MKGLIGRKIGMTRIFNKEGVSIAVTIIKIEENRVTQIKKIETDGYRAIQLTTGFQKPNRINKSKYGHFSKNNLKIGNILCEFRIKNNEKFTIGQIINLNIFTDIKKVDISGTSKGKGFSGTIKRWNFCSQDASHGNSLSHRAPGSIGQNQTPGKVFKGKKMAGHLGHERITIQNLDIVQIDLENNLLLVKGATPGARGCNLIIKQSIKK